MACMFYKTYCWFMLALILIFFVTVNTQEVSYDSDVNKLRMCIEDSLSKDFRLHIGNSVGNVSKVIAYRLCFKSFNRRQFTQAIENIYYFIKTSRSYLFSKNHVPLQLRVAIRDAMKNCIGRKNLPRFEDEPRELAEFLDFVLVDWPTDISEMIMTQDGRSTLRRFAFSAGMRLMSALRSFSMNYAVFHGELLKIWIQRAQRYFDGQDHALPYIRHRFTTDRDRLYSPLPLEDVHTIDDVDSFNPRTSKDFLYRNAIFDMHNSRQILNNFELGPSSTTDVQLSAAEYYLGNCIIRCYRIIMYTLELQLRGISTDGDDFYNGPIPSDVVPFYIQRIACSGSAYRNYLKAWREHLQRFSNEEVEKCFSREDLIMILSFMVIRRTSSGTITTTNAITTTTTEFPGCDEGSKKDGARSGDCEKYFLPNKRFKTMSPDKEQQSRNATTTTTTELPGHDGGSKKGGTRNGNRGKYFLPNKKFKTSSPDQEQQPGQSGNSGNHYGYIFYHDHTKDFKEFDQSTNFVDLSIVIGKMINHSYRNFM